MLNVFLFEAEDTALRKVRHSLPYWSTVIGACKDEYGLSVAANIRLGYIGTASEGVLHGVQSVGSFLFKNVEDVTMNVSRQTFPVRGKFQSNGQVSVLRLSVS